MSVRAFFPLPCEKSLRCRIERRRRRWCWRRSNGIFTRTISIRVFFPFPYSPIGFPYIHWLSTVGIYRPSLLNVSYRFVYFILIRATTTHTHCVAIKFDSWHLFILRSFFFFTFCFSVCWMLIYSYKDESMIRKLLECFGYAYGVFNTDIVALCTRTQAFKLVYIFLSGIYWVMSQRRKGRRETYENGCSDWFNCGALVKNAWKIALKQALFPVFFFHFAFLHSFTSSIRWLCNIDFS